MQNNKIIAHMAVLILVAFLSGCATTPAPVADKRDPYENFNRGVQKFNDKLDDYVMKPVATGYQWIMPSFADRGVTNFFSNINDIGVTINDLLQAKFAQGGQDGARFLINTIAGIGGFVDVADMIDLPKHNEDFDQTLGVWGASTGPYLVLPFFGPSSPRGIGGLIGDGAFNPISYYFGTPFIAIGLYGIDAVDTRADNLSTEKIASEAALDRYEFFKNAYLQRRKYLVYDGKIPEEKKQEEFDIEEELDKLGPVEPF